MNDKNPVLLAVLIREACRARVRAGLGHSLPHDQAAIAWLKEQQETFSSQVDILLGEKLSDENKQVIEKG